MIEHVEIMYQETARQSKACTDQIVLNNSAIKSTIGQFKKKAKENVKRSKSQRQNTKEVMSGGQADFQDSQSVSDPNEVDITGIQLGDGTYQELEQFDKNMQRLTQLIRKTSITNQKEVQPKQQMANS